MKGLKEHSIVKAGKPYVSLLIEVAKRWGIPEVLLSHQVNAESSFRPSVVSPAGAVGLMQIMPTTAPAVAKRHGIPAGPLTDPRVNLNLGAAYMRELFNAAWKFRPDPKGAYKLALAGYLAGPRRIREIAQGIRPMTSTEDAYVKKVIWDFEKTELWSQLKPPRVKVPGWLGWLLLLAGGLYLYKEQKT